MSACSWATQWRANKVFPPPNGASIQYVTIERRWDDIPTVAGQAEWCVLGRGRGGCGLCCHRKLHVFSALTSG